MAVAPGMTPAWLSLTVPASDALVICAPAMRRETCQQDHDHHHDGLQGLRT